MVIFNKHKYIPMSLEEYEDNLYSSWHFELNTKHDPWYDDTDYQQGKHKHFCDEDIDNEQEDYEDNTYDY